MFTKKDREMIQSLQRQVEGLGSSAVTMRRDHNKLKERVDRVVSEPTGGSFVIHTGDVDYEYGFKDNEPRAVIVNGRRFVPEERTLADIMVEVKAAIARAIPVPPDPKLPRPWLEMFARGAWSPSKHQTDRMVSEMRQRRPNGVYLDPAHLAICLLHARDEDGVTR